MLSIWNVTTVQKTIGLLIKLVINISISDVIINRSKKPVITSF